MELTLKQARLLRGFKQKEIADRLNVHVQTYRKMEKYPDSITIGQAKEICRILNIGCDYIFFNQNSTFGGVSQVGYPPKEEVKS